MAANDSASGPRIDPQGRRDGDRITLLAPGKVNLALHVTGQRSDGYHLIESLVAFADIGDVVVVSLAAEPSLDLTGPLADGVPGGPDNLALRAAAFMGVPARIVLEKHLPAQAGIGGGSADAAAVLRGLAQLSGRSVPAGVEALGADVPVCLLARAARMSGVGEQVRQVSLPPLPAVMVNPGVSISTPPVFGALMRKRNAPLPELPEMTDPEEVADWLAEQRNDLEIPAISLAPEVSATLTELRNLSPLLARMSGSGATCFALFKTVGRAKEAAARLSRARPDWWVRQVVLA